MQNGRVFDIAMRDGRKLPVELIAKPGERAPGVLMIPPIFGWRFFFWGWLESMLTMPPC